jgi:hypothetical protein
VAWKIQGKIARLRELARGYLSDICSVCDRFKWTNLDLIAIISAVIISAAIITNHV